MPKKARFIDNKDGTVSDTQTGLMWEKVGNKDYLTFKEAEKYCKKLALAGKKNWRLPTREELVSIVDYTRSNPAIDPVFESNSSWYWSSSKVAGYADSVWCVNFDSGHVGWDYGHNYRFVRAVRQY